MVVSRTPSVGPNKLYMLAKSREPYQFTAEADPSFLYAIADNDEGNVNISATIFSASTPAVIGDLLRSRLA
jgi:hypothetical protein